MMDWQASDDERAVGMRRAAIAGIAGLMALAMPTAAGAATIKHEGTIADQPGAQVKFAVKKTTASCRRSPTFASTAFRSPATTAPAARSQLSCRTSASATRRSSPARGRSRGPGSATAPCAHSARSGATAERPVATFASPSSHRRARAAGPASSTGRRRSAELRLRPIPEPRPVRRPVPRLASGARPA